MSSSKCDQVQVNPGAARVGVWVLRWTHRLYLEDQNFNIYLKLSSIFDIDKENNNE